jgi:hypothetical protein
MSENHDFPLIGIVGVCASGKTTLSAKLSQLGFHCRHIAQEHSYVPDMWQRLTNPDLLIFLEVSYPITISRRKLNWTLEEYSEQVYRLRHAHLHANLILNTDELTPDQVWQSCLELIERTVKNQ